MRKGIIAIIIAALMTVCCIACGSSVEAPPAHGGEAVNPVVSSSTELRLLDSDYKLTQEQAVSRIRADLIKEKGGYTKDDVVTAIVQLDGAAMVDTYLDGKTGLGSVGEYAASAPGVAQAKRIAGKQDALIHKLDQNKLITGVTNRYDTIVNGFAVTVPYGNIQKIEAMDGVSSVILCDTYNRPQSVDVADASGIINDVDVYETGIFNSKTVDYTGKGTAVAVLDSGFDCSHSVFNDHKLDDADLWIKRDFVESKLSETKAAKTTPGLEISDVWYSNKIPFMYDYADKDKDVFPYDSEHGTHVAGIIGGSDEVITGVAVDTQLVLMKVFPDLRQGAETDDIIAALEDAVTLGVDAINLSLGSSCGFTREADEEKINVIYDKIYEVGISLLTAASNSYSSSFGGAQGNTNFVTNPDSGTVGSPSTYEASLCVASISGVKSRYLVANDTQIVFFHESNSIAGKENDFIKELYESQNLDPTKPKTFEYVTIPGFGKRVNYTGLDVEGKIALVKRGDTTFEDKALRAKAAKAVACIIYNNIEGDITMSMGKSDHIPTVSIAKDVGTELAKNATGTITVSMDYQAGPFMSDYSSWGPTPDLNIKPEITAHGGKIYSSVPGGGYDEMSGTSMATPNLCGIVVLIRQFLKDKYPDYTQKQIVILANQMLMSTATIVINEEANPYSPRKQGAGLASLYNVVNTKAYLSVDGKDKTKLELKDDPKRTGQYTMQFNVVNVSSDSVSYDLSLVAMTETVSKSDVKHVAEKDQILGGSYTVSVSGGTQNGNSITVEGNRTAAVTVVYSMSDADKKTIDSLFPYGMYVEGFVKLKATYEKGINLNVPFLAFYGDWMQAPMFDKTYYDVETEAHDDSIDDEDKLKADYFATTPYASYYYNYIIPFGTYLYDLPAGYEFIPATEEHAAVSEDLATLDGFSAVYGGLLRNAKTMRYTITDKLTGEIVHEYIDYNAVKAHSDTGTPMPYYDYINWKARQFNFINNRQYEFKMTGLLDYGDGGVTTNVNNTFKFDFTFDNEAPVIKSCSYEKEYDSTLKKDRYYLDIVVYDNHYVQSITPIVFTSRSSYATLTDEPIPVYSEKGKDNLVRIEITDMLKDIYYDSLITSSLAFMVDDYALNANIYLCQLPGTRGDFKFTRNGNMDASELSVLTIYEDEIVDLTQYLATADKTVDENKDYLRYMRWFSTNENVATVSQGQVRGIAPGRTTITVIEQMELERANIIINVKAREAEPAAQSDNAQRTLGSKPQADSKNDVEDVNDATLEEVRFTYFETKFAYSRAAQRSMIGSTGSKIFINSLKSRLSLYPGEKIQLVYDIKPWYVDDRYEKTYTTSDDTIAAIEQDGTLTAKKKGSASITLKLKDKVTGKESNMMAYLPVTVNSEFIIEDRTLIAYKGLGGVDHPVIIPDDEGILYIGAYAFCLYETDNTIELTEEDYDANKIPAANTTITEVVVPEGVEDVQKYAFYNCTGLKKVTLPKSIKFVRDYAFYNDADLEEINLENVLAIGPHAFEGCKSLKSVDLSKAYAIADYGFADCSALESLDITALRNTGAGAFRGTKALKSVTMDKNGHTKLAPRMFAKSGLTSVDIYDTVWVPEFCFAQCTDLETVIIHNDLVNIDYGAFCQDPKLKTVTIMGAVESIGEQAFYDCNALTSFTLPDCDVAIGTYAFYDCDALAELKLGAHTKITKLDASIFGKTALATFTVDAANTSYASSGYYLTNKAGDTIVFAAAALPAAITIDASQYKEIGTGAFGRAEITTLNIVAPGDSEIKIGAYAFENCESLTEVNLPARGVKSIGEYAFYGTKALDGVANLGEVPDVGDYAFASSGIKTAAIKAGASYGDGVFYRARITSVTVGANARIGGGAFRECHSLTTVTMPAEGGVHFGRLCFATCTSLIQIDLTKIDAELEEETFYECKSLMLADLANVESIGDYAFADCAALKTVRLPKVKTIGKGVFSQYGTYNTAPAIVALALPDTLESIGEGAFLACPDLREIAIPAGVGAIEDFTFSYCVSLVKVTLPDSVKSIGKYAFAGCDHLETINLGKVETFADYAFGKAISLEDISLAAAKEIGEGAFSSSGVWCEIEAPELVKVGDVAFLDTHIKAITAPKLAHIGRAAFQNNSLIKEFTFSDDLEFIGAGAFYGCSAITEFYRKSGDGQLNAGSINDYAQLIDGVLYTALKNGDLALSSVPAAKNMTTFEVAPRTVAIDAYAGNQNKNVMTLVLNDGLKSIGNYAFYGYDKLSTVEFNSYCAPTLENTYDPAAKLTSEDPGYELLHSQFDLFGYDLCYFTFVDLAGKKEPIAMILPANGELVGYDSLVFRAYFGDMEKASRSTYIAMDENTANFIDYAKRIKRIQTINFADEKLINDALSALDAMEQKASDYGYSDVEWKELVDAVKNAKSTLDKMKGTGTPAPVPAAPTEEEKTDAALLWLDILVIAMSVVVVAFGAFMIFKIVGKKSKKEGDK